MNTKDNEVNPDDGWINEYLSSSDQSAGENSEEFEIVRMVWDILENCWTELDE